MSQTTKSLNMLIARMDEDLTAQIKRAYEAERSLDILKEAASRHEQDTEDAVRWAVARVQREDQRTRDDLVRVQDRIVTLERENLFLSTKLAKYVGTRIKEASLWLRETDIEEMTKLLNANQTVVDGYERPPMNPLTDKIPMIKYVRDTWDLGLKESKDIVDAWYAERPVGGIEQYQAEGR